ncbi:MAG: hypothetical protein AAF813_01640, partial [Pseudomonadota bacterium]
MRRFCCAVTLALTALAPLAQAQTAGHAPLADLVFRPPVVAAQAICRPPAPEPAADLTPEHGAEELT